ncbi:MAG: hypothetical protein L0Y72_19235 [Gemmataceae bacterium]|nr:hypothetical protein [Gemmataceae bacterium]
MRGFSLQDGHPVPKIIDFGVAKALHQHLTDQSMYTEIGQIVGTLEYMSPEQAELSALDIDTRQPGDAAAHRAGAAGQGGARRARLDRDEGAGEGPHAPL